LVPTKIRVLDAFQEKDDEEDIEDVF